MASKKNTVSSKLVCSTIFRRCPPQWPPTTLESKNVSGARSATSTISFGLLNGTTSSSKRLSQNSPKPRDARYSPRPRHAPPRQSHPMRYSTGHRPLRLRPFWRYNPTSSRGQILLGLALVRTRAFTTSFSRLPLSPQPRIISAALQLSLTPMTWAST